MKIYLTHPRGVVHPLLDKIRARWAAAECICPVKAVENFPYETHGELLTRIWNEIRCDTEDKDRIYLISETDFIPDLEGLAKLADPAWWGDRKLILCQNVIRGPALEMVLVHDQAARPISAPWFIALNLQHLRQLPPVNWLGAGGPRNDAANLALEHAQASTFAYPPEILILEGRDAQNYYCAGNTGLIQKGLMGVDYPGWGVHCFFTRHFNDPPETELLPGTGYTLARHLSNIQEALHATDPAQVHRSPE